MRLEIILLVLVVGAATWALRFFPSRMRLQDMDPNGALSRFLAATGPAAIAALCVASGLPLLQGAGQAALFVGIVTVLLVFWIWRSVVVSTLAGAAAYGAMVWWVG